MAIEAKTKGGPMQKNNLHAQIDALARLNVDDDPQVQKAREKREGLERKLGEVSSRIEQLNAHISKQEGEMADQMLAGGAAAVDGVNKLRRQISDAEGEIKIISLAIERAKQTEEGVRKSVRGELLKRALELFVAQHVEFNQQFAATVKAHGELKKAHGVLYGLGLTYTLRRFITSLELELFDLEKDLADYERELKDEAWQRI